jgi:uncharacterized protein (UPF0262 family)
MESREDCIKSSSNSSSAGSESSSSAESCSKSSWSNSKLESFSQDKQKQASSSISYSKSRATQNEEKSKRKKLCLEFCQDEQMIGFVQDSESDSSGVDSDLECEEEKKSYVNSEANDQVSSKSFFGQIFYKLSYGIKMMNNLEWKSESIKKAKNADLNEHLESNAPSAQNKNQRSLVDLLKENIFVPIEKKASDYVFHHLSEKFPKLAQILPLVSKKDKIQGAYFLFSFDLFLPIHRIIESFDYEQVLEIENTVVLQLPIMEDHKEIEDSIVHLQEWKRLILPFIQDSQLVNKDKANNSIIFEANFEITTGNYFKTLMDGIKHLKKFSLDGKGNILSLWMLNIDHNLSMFRKFLSFIENTEFMFLVISQKNKIISKNTTKILLRFITKANWSVITLKNFTFTEGLLWELSKNSCSWIIFSNWEFIWEEGFPNKNYHDCNRTVFCLIDCKFLYSKTNQSQNCALPMISKFCYFVYNTIYDDYVISHQQNSDYVCSPPISEKELPCFDSNCSISLMFSFCLFSELYIQIWDLSISSGLCIELWMFPLSLKRLHLLRWEIVFGEESDRMTRLSSLQWLVLEDCTFRQTWDDWENYVYGMDMLLCSLRFSNYDRPFVLDLRDVKLYFIAMSLLLNECPLSKIYSKFDSLWISSEILPKFYIQRLVDLPFKRLEELVWVKEKFKYNFWNDIEIYSFVSYQETLSQEGRLFLCNWIVRKSIFEFLMQYKGFEHLYLLNWVVSIPLVEEERIIWVTDIKKLRMYKWEFVLDQEELIAAATAQRIDKQEAKRYLEIYWDQYRRL